mgnify:CR=1 FL=1
MAMVCVLSVFNGFGGIVEGMFSAFDPDLKITPKAGKVFNYDNDTFKQVLSNSSIQMFSENLACPKCGYSFPEINPKLFSFNSPYGACPECHGLGFKLEVEPDYIFDMNKSLEDGAAMNMGKDTFMVNMYREEIT